MQCDCAKKVQEKLDATNTNTKLDLAFTLGGKDDLDLSGMSYKVCVVKKDRKVRKSPVSLFASFCPFCGSKCSK